MTETRPKTYQLVWDALADGPADVETLAVLTGRSYPSVHQACFAGELFGDLTVSLGARTGRRRRLLYSRAPGVTEPTGRLVNRKRSPLEMTDRNREVCEAWFADETLTLEALGERFGITRERVRQILSSHPDYVAVRDHRRTERAAAVAERRDAERRARTRTATCFTCGTVYETVRRFRPDHRDFCSPEHREIANTLRLVISAEGRERHRRLIAEHVLRHPEMYDDIRLRHARRVLEGVDERRGRWLIPGSLVQRWAQHAVDARWPIADRIVPEIRAQLRDPDHHQQGETP